MELILSKFSRKTFATLKLLTTLSVSFIANITIIMKPSTAIKVFYRFEEAVEILTDSGTHVNSDSLIGLDFSSKYVKKPRLIYSIR